MCARVASAAEPDVLSSETTGFSHHCYGRHVQLTEAEVSGYRRFSAKSLMDLSGFLVCIVGPNAAGKSSFLDALIRFNTSDDFGDTERTRTEGGGQVSTSLRALFDLDGDDRAVLSNIPEAAGGKTLEVFKNDGQSLAYLISPYPHRNLEPRHKLASRFDELTRSPWLEKAVTAEGAVPEPPVPTIGQLVVESADAARTDDGDLEEERLAKLEELSSRLRAVVSGEALPDLDDPPKKFQSLPERIEELIALERQTAPHRRAVDELIPRVPRFVKFDDGQRNLKAAYDLTGEPDDAIQNLLALAGTTWQKALEVAESADEGRKKVFLNDTLAALNEEITEAWSQLPLRVSFYLDGTTLTILMEMQANDYIKIDQQSDGLRQFVALRAFIANQSATVPPIVLIDEAETHLHYDAQADLINVLEEQEEAGKVIYTTHSAGCLPRDLGVGIRGIVPIETEGPEGPRLTDHSRIINGFWFEEHGFSPLLIAMGASAFAFSSAQKAAITEGFTDALLLPSLIREATGAKRLEYQVVPRFAGATAEEILNFDLIAPRLVCVADGDKGGEDHAANLAANGIAEDHVVFLGGDEKSGLSLEDLIAEDVILAALDHQLRDHDLQYPPSALPETGRSKAIKDWFAEQEDSNGISLRLNKPALAQRVLDLRRERSLLAASQKSGLVGLDTSIREILDTPSAGSINGV
jgi:energy-coupling factor transporter ATP-binding protein EcfA2